jgi:hypothetical protein
VKIPKRYLGKIVYIKWIDVASKHRTTLNEFKDFYLYESVGWLVKATPFKIMLAHEKCLTEKGEMDLTILHPSLVVGYSVLQCLKIAQKGVKNGSKPTKQ